jgi:hypothetical protein
MLACGVQQDSAPVEQGVFFACQTDSDCPIGDCLSEFGLCSRQAGQLTTLLFEVTPQASDAVYGGGRFLAIRRVDAAPAPGTWLELNVPPPVPVVGRVLAAPEQTACVSPATPASSTLPVTLTFTPRQRLLGLSVPSYELSTTFDDSPGVREYTFQGSLPPGRYDVYMRPDVAALGENCRAIPQIFRDRSIGVSSNGSQGQPFELQQPPPSSLRLSIAWRDNLEGWLLDMVHPVTGEVISNRVRLHVEDVNPATNGLETVLDYSRADSDFIPDTGEELVRLTPPTGLAAGTVLLQRLGLELLTPGEGAIGDVSSFGSPVLFQSWVWKEGEPDASVPGSVSFAALDLDEVAEGVLASFEKSAVVDDDGKVRLSLLPGRYRIRVTPPGLAVVDLGLMAGFESSVIVWPNPSEDTAMQSGHVIEVPAAVTLRGQTVAELGGLPTSGIEVRATASNPNRDACLQSPEGPAAVSCEASRRAVLQKALAQDPFVPRTRSTLTQGDGGFELNGLDCGQCQPGAGAGFDLSVRPPPKTGLPWLVRPSINLYSTQLLAPLSIPVPVARPMRLTYGDPADATQGARALPGALVRVFALIDDQAQVTDDADLVPCISVTTPGAGRCLQSLLQVAELRSDSEGELLLLLPPSLE